MNLLKRKNGGESCPNQNRSPPFQALSGIEFVHCRNGLKKSTPARNLGEEREDMIKRQSEKPDETSEPSMKLAASKSDDIPQSPYINFEEENENLDSPELELDPNLDPLEAARTRGPDRNWKE